MGPSAVCTVPSIALVEVGLYVQDKPYTHNNPDYILLNLGGVSQLLIFYCNSSHHLAQWATCNAQNSPNRSHLYILLDKRVVLCLNIEPVSLLYCQSLLKSAIEHVPTATASRSVFS